MFVNFVAGVGMLPGPSVSILSRSPRSPHSPNGGPLSAGLTDPSPPPGQYRRVQVNVFLSFPRTLSDTLVDNVVILECRGRKAFTIIPYTRNRA